MRALQRVWVYVCLALTHGYFLRHPVSALATARALRRCKFLTEGSTPRCGRRVLPVTLSHHHKPFGSARIARGLRAPDLVGAAPRTVARRAPWAREKGFDQDRRIIHDSPHQRVQSRQRGLEWIRVLRNVSCVAREGTCPTGIEYCRRRFGDRLQNAIIAFRPPWYPTEPPHALRRATQARWMASAPTTSGSSCTVRWVPPPVTPPRQ